ncbi:MAG TPA: hypothetical protein VEU78_10750 [Steroidobacteraceae bacterium]|nr:hypothetical protein [Steroidobacteraceae bacterium]
MAAGKHLRYQGLAEKKWAESIRAKGGLDSLRVVSERLRGLVIVNHDARIVDEHIYMTELAKDRLGEALDAPCVSHIKRREDRPAVLFGKARLDLSPSDLVSAANHDSVPAPGELNGGLKAKSAYAARDHGDPVLIRHGQPSIGSNAFSRIWRRASI